jgi:hypothetical protein
MELKISILGLLLALLTLDSASSQDMPSAKKSAPIIGKLVIDPCSTVISGGKANLRIGALSRQAQAYIGDYQFKVSPYFFKNEKGKLSIEVSDDTLNKLASGMSVDFTGQATTSGSGQTRRIDGKATPAGNVGAPSNSGSSQALKKWYSPQPITLMKSRRIRSPARPIERKMTRIEVGANAAPNGIRRVIPPMKRRC